MFAPEGFPIIAATGLISGLLGVLGYLVSGPWSGASYVAGVLLLAFVLFFFRDPERIPPGDLDTDHAVLAPADGRVVQIREVTEAEFVGGPATQISIFLSVFNVHVNRIPAEGTLTYVDYHSGSFHVAWHEKASEENEHAAFGLEHPTGTPIFFKQIAGLIARRIVYHVEEGDSVYAGERFGMIRFGSRVDVVVPSTVSVEVEEGDVVRAGLTLLGRIPSGGAAAAPAESGEKREVVTR